MSFSCGLPLVSFLGVRSCFSELFGFVAVVLGLFLSPDTEADSPFVTDSESTCSCIFEESFEMSMAVFGVLRLRGASLRPTTSFKATRFSFTLFEDGSMLTNKTVTKHTTSAH